MGYMLTDRELASLRADTESSFPDTATIKRLPTDGVTSTQRGTYGVVETNICRVENVDERTAPFLITYATGGIVQTRNFRTIYLPHDADVVRGDQVIVNGSTYHVLDVEGESTWRLCTRIHVNKL